MKDFRIVRSKEYSENLEELRLEAMQAVKNRKKREKETGKKISPGWQEAIYKKVLKTTEQLGPNPRHPRLQTHPFDGRENPYNKDEKVFEAYVENKTPTAYRIFWCYGPDRKDITVIALTPHS